MGYRSMFNLACLIPALAAVMLVASCNLLDRSAQTQEQQRLEELARQHVHLVRHQLEKWAEDHNGLYPDNIDELIVNGNFEDFPQNPATRSPMRSVGFDAADRNGNFSYFPVYGDDSVIGFYLLGYGFSEGGGNDINGDGEADEVQVVLSSAGGGLPPVEQVISGTDGTPPLLFTRLDSIHKELQQWGQANRSGDSATYPAALPAENGPVTLPQNPIAEGSMRQVSIGSEDRAGNFSYIPFTFNGEIRGYYLLGYGKGETPGYDVDRDGTPDNVVKILRSGPASMPELHILIGQIRSS